MTHTDPYQTPSSDVTNDSDLIAYAESRYFVVKSGFVAPRICYYTGRKVEDDVRPIQVLMSQRVSEPYLIYLVVVILAVNFVMFREISFWLIILIVFGIGLSGIVYKKYSQRFSIYCERKLRKVFFIKNLIGNILSATGLVLLLSSETYLVIGLIFIFGSSILLKRTLKAAGRNGEYEQYEGAHQRFLDALPRRERDPGELF